MDCAEEDGAVGGREVVTLYVFVYWVPIIMEIIYNNGGTEGKILVVMKERPPNPMRIRKSIPNSYQYKKFSKKLFLMTM